MIGYARVSTAEQNVEMQIDALMRAGVDRQDIYFESASGAKNSRPELENALRASEAGDTIVVWKLDRIARSLIHLLELLQRLEAEGVKFRSLTEGVETETPAGRMIMHVLGALAEFERDLIRERTRAGVEAAKRRGVKFGARKQVSDEAIAKAWKRVYEGDETRVLVAKELKITTHQLARRLKDHEAKVASRVPKKKAVTKKRALKRRGKK